MHVSLSLSLYLRLLSSDLDLERRPACGADISIAAPPSIYPAKKYCDITGHVVRSLRPRVTPIWLVFSARSLRVFAHFEAFTGVSQAKYTDPATGLRYKDASVYKWIKENLTTPEKVEAYLERRGAGTAIK